MDLTLYVVGNICFIMQLSLILVGNLRNSMTYMAIEKTYVVYFKCLNLEKINKTLFFFGIEDIKSK